jgi:hypothetical protein
MVSRAWPPPTTLTQLPSPPLAVICCLTRRRRPRPPPLSWTQTQTRCTPGFNSDTDIDTALARKKKGASGPGHHGSRATRAAPPVTRKLFHFENPFKPSPTRARTLCVWLGLVTAATMVERNQIRGGGAVEGEAPSIEGG